MTRKLWVLEDDVTFKWALLAVGLTLGTAAAVLMLWPCLALCLTRRRQQSRNAVAPEPSSGTADGQQHPHDPLAPVTAEIKLQDHVHSQVTLQTSSGDRFSQQATLGQQQAVGTDHHLQQSQQQQQMIPVMQQPAQQQWPSLQAPVHTPAALQSASAQVNGVAALTAGVTVAARPAVPPPLPPGPIPLSALVPVTAVRGGLLPPLATTAIAPAAPPAPVAPVPGKLAAAGLTRTSPTAAQAPVQQLLVHQTAMTAQAPTLQLLKQQEAGQAAAMSMHQAASLTAYDQAGANSLTHWLEPSTTQRQQQQQQQLQLQQQSANMQPPWQPDRPPQQAAAHSQQKSPRQPIFTKLAAALQQREQTLGQAMLHHQQQGHQPSTQQASVASVLVAGPAVPDVYKPGLGWLMSLLRHLVADATATELLHAHALLLLLLPSAGDGDSHGPQGTKHNSSAVAGSNTLITAVQQKLAVELDQAFATAVQLHAAAAGGRDPSDVLMRLQEYLNDNHELMEEVMAAEQLQLHLDSKPCSSSASFPVRRADSKIGLSVCVSMTSDL